MTDASLVSESNFTSEPANLICITSPLAPPETRLTSKNRVGGECPTKAALRGGGAGEVSMYFVMKSEALSKMRRQRRGPVALAEPRPQPLGRAAPPTLGDEEVRRTIISLLSL
ncbi:hypothetical protein E2C01_057850 [Portunus trituberculatus]|uniref:Uncharacterized protein n=1 Tax=Portunus trituberculatus TaxID=210409 RepID=A0A5B7H337_PORTR|nr:hypothetical protein [Portunus trituberculatus]